MSSQNSQLIKDIKQCVFDFDKNAKVFLFGSQARGDAKADSDWDIFILSDKSISDKDRFFLYDNFFELNLKYDLLINPVVESIDVWNKYYYMPFFENIKKEGIQL